VDIWSAAQGSELDPDPDCPVSVQQGCGQETDPGILVCGQREYGLTYMQLQKVHKVLRRTRIPTILLLVRRRGFGLRKGDKEERGGEEGGWGCEGGGEG